MASIQVEKRADNKVIYIAREIERALGKTPGPDYFIITNKNEYAEKVQKNFPDFVFLITSDEILDTLDLLQLEEVQNLIKKIDGKLLVFKNNSLIEDFCKEKGWTLINPSAELSEKIENKITQIDWLGDMSSFLPPHSVSTHNNITWQKKPFILQWANSHTGEGTLLIQNEKDLNKLKEKFPHREAKVTEFIKGPVFTSNIVVTDTVILLGNISYQITGILPFTDNPFSTIGNDWSVTYTILGDKQINDFETIAEKISQKMQKDGWRGLFGIDVVYDEERDEIKLIEINARQPASTTFESEIQATVRAKGVSGITIFEAHVDSLCHIPIKTALVPINDGAQIIQRVTKALVKADMEKLIHAGYKVISYKNDKPNADLYRIQSAQGIMETHTKFNTRGKEILELLS